MTGAYSGLVQGATKAMLGDGIDMVPQHILGGAMSGFARTLMLNALMGAPFVASQEVRNSSVSGIIRKGGLVGLFTKGFKINGMGVTLGRNAFSDDGYVGPQVHEFYHINDIERMGWAYFYARWLGELMKYGFGGMNKTKGTLECEAYELEYNWLKGHGLLQ